jgi:ubiquinone/menaquinone biosynthesis C-methylase UbiE
MALTHLLVRQLARPSRLTGRLINVTNASINDQALQLLAPNASDHVLEVGFGGGRIALAKLLTRAAFVAGIEPSPASVRAARKRFRHHLEAGRIEIQRAAVEAIPYQANSFTSVLTVSTIYFWPDPKRGLREILRVLCPGGRRPIATETRRVPRPITRQGFTQYTREQQDALLRAGFSVVDFERADPFLFALATKG